MKKNIVVVTSVVPFYYGGNERLMENLTNALNSAGFNAWSFQAPRNRYDSFTKLLSGYISNRFIDLRGYPWKQDIHQIISISYPSYVIPHKNHVCWLAHRMREYYDLWPRWLESHTGTFIKSRLLIQRKMLHGIDNHYIRKLSRLYCISNTVKERLKIWGGHDAGVVHPPPQDDRNYRATEYKPYIFTVSRLTELKRIHLLIESMKLVKNKKFKAIIAGDGEERENLEKLITLNKLQDRVKIVGKISEEEKHRLLIECRAFYFAPYNEEYGIAAMEAMKRSKAVITSPDAGGPLDFVEHNKNGIITIPESKNMAEAIDHLADDEKLSRRFGTEALNRVKSITWENTIKKLVII